MRYSCERSPARRPGGPLSHFQKSVGSRSNFEYHSASKHLASSIATRICGAIQVPRRIPYQAVNGLCSVCSPAEHMQYHQLSLGSELEHHTAASRVASEVSSQLRNAVEIPIRIAHQPWIRLRAICTLEAIEGCYLSVRS